MFVLEILNQAFMITGFVFVVMLVIEYINVQTNGEWQQKLVQFKWGQYVLAATLGVIPGCLGAFVVVAMFSHRILSIGAVVAAMIATSGDESFIMLAIIPQKALLLFLLLFIIGIVAGAITDTFIIPRLSLKMSDCKGLQIHDMESCHCYPSGKILQQWKERSPFRTTLAIVLTLFIITVITGQIGPVSWNWMRISIVLLSIISLFIVSTVPDHFLEEHLWQHVAKEHIPKIFLWTFGTLLVLHVLVYNLHLEGFIKENQWIVFFIAILVGMIPESGPHLMFVTLYAEGIIPFGILFASSIVQDGHGMLPMLSYSKRAFVIIKLVNLIIGLLFGAIVIAMDM